MAQSVATTSGAIAVAITATKRTVKGYSESKYQNESKNLETMDINANMFDAW